MNHITLMFQRQQTNNGVRFIPKNGKAHDLTQFADACMLTQTQVNKLRDDLGYRVEEVP